MVIPIIVGAREIFLGGEENSLTGKFKIRGRTETIPFTAWFKLLEEIKGPKDLRRLCHPTEKDINFLDMYMIY